LESPFRKELRREENEQEAKDREDDGTVFTQAAIKITFQGDRRIPRDR
jgi:hypothetical protein